MQRLDKTGSVAPGQMGGHKPKTISGEHAVWLSQRIKNDDFTLRAFVAELAGRGLKVDYHSVWDFVHAEKLSFQKSVVAGERDRPDVAGGTSNGQSIKIGEAERLGLHRRDLDQDRHVAFAGMGAPRTQAPNQGASRPLEDHDLPGGIAQ